jgi:regulator of vacuolar morphogenesis
VRLPLRAFTLEKRYSDFTVLQDQFIQVVGLPPPIPLPKKHFLSSTLNNPVLVEERRKGLEEYLQGIITSEDSHWRDSPPWRTFLNLPVLNHRSRKDEKVKEEDWLEVHKQAKILLQDARRHLSRRSTAPTIKDQHSASAAAKRCLVLAGTKVTTLQNQLNAVEREDGTLGDGERRRRRDLIRELNTEILGLERLSQAITMQRTTLSVPNASEQPSNPLFVEHSPQSQIQQGSTQGGVAVSSRRVFGAPQETERTKGLDNQELLQLQQTVMKEQDDTMDGFLQQVRRTKGLAEQINEELVSQLDLLDGLEDDVDRVQGKIKRAQRRADKLS